MKRRILGMILTLVMVLSMLPATALTAWAAEDDIIPQADDDEVAPPADEEAIFDSEGTEDSPDQTADEVVSLADEEGIFDSGSGTEEDPYLISTAEQLIEFANRVNKGEYSLCAKLVDDIALDSSTVWTPIGGSTAATAFKGTLDGGGFEITGLNVTGTTYQGLFGYVGSGGTVKNVTVSGTVTGSTLVGGVAARNAGTIKNCYNGCDVTGKTTSSSTSTQGVGGVVGYNDGTIANCHNTGTVVNDGTSGYTGGVVGYAASGNTVSSSHNEGEVDGSAGSTATGGVVGYITGSSSKVENCYNEGAVTGASSGTKYTGGVVGRTYSSAAVQYCYNTGTVEGTTSSVGGIAGSASKAPVSCYYLSEDGSAIYSNGEPKTEDDFASGEVAWLLQNSQDGQAWGQRLTGIKDHYPVLTNDSSIRVWKVTFTASSPAVDETDYYNNGAAVRLPAGVTLSDGSCWVDSVTGETITAGTRVENDINATAGKRIQFGGDSGVINANELTGELTYPLSTANTPALNLDQYMAYEDGSDAAGKFTYEITDGNGELGATLAADGKTLTIPKTAPAGDFLLTITAHEKTPQIVAFAAVTSFGTSDVELKVKVVINKGTPKLGTTKPSALSPTYNGNAQALVKAGSAATNGTVWYSLGDPEGEYGPEIPTATAPGTYNVYYMIKGNDNYEDVYYKDAPLVATIEMEKVTINSDPGKTTTIEYGSWVTFTVEPSTGEYPEGTKVEFELSNGESLGQAVYRDGKYELSVQVLSTYGFRISTQTSGSSANIISFKVNGVASSGTTYVKTAKKALTAAIPYYEKEYDNAKTTGALTLILTGGVEECDEGKVSAAAKCQFDSADAGKNKPLTLISSPGITLSGDSAGYYNLDKANITDGTGGITPRGITAPAQTFDYNGSTKFTFTMSDVDTGVTDKTAAIEYTTSSSSAGVYTYGTSGNNTYTAKVTNTDNFEVTGGEPVTISGWTGETTIIVSSTSVIYGDKDLTMSVGPLSVGAAVEFTVNGQPIDAEGVFSGGMYMLTVPVNSAYGFKTGIAPDFALYPDAEDPRSNTITATVTEGGGTDTYEATVTVERKALTAKIPDDYTRQYNGSKDIESGALKLILTGVEDCDNISATAKCQFDSMDVGEWPITLTSSPGITLSGDNKSYYTLTSKNVADGKGVITPFELTAPAQSFTYDSSRTSPFTFTKTVTTTVRRGSETSTKNVEVEYTISGSDVGAYSYSASDASGEYTYTAKVTNSGNFVVTGGEPVSIVPEAEVQITLSSSSVTYGGMLTISTDSLPEGYDVAFGVNGTYTDELKAGFYGEKYVVEVPVTSANGFAAPTGTTSTSSNTITVRVNGGENGGKASVTLSKKALTAAIPYYEKEYDNAKTTGALTLILTGGVEECDEGKVSAAAKCQFDSADAGKNKPLTLISSPDITLSGDKAGYYTLVKDNIADGTGAITPLGITAPEQTFDYSGKNTFTVTGVDAGAYNKFVTIKYTTSSVGAGVYTYGTSGNNTYTAEVTNTNNFEVIAGEPVTIEPAKEISVLVSSRNGTVTYGDKDDNALTISVGPLPEEAGVEFAVNGQPIDSSGAVHNDGRYVLTVPVTSAYGFKSGASPENQVNTITVTVAGHENPYEITVTVARKTLTATIGSHTKKTYDGDKTTGALSLILAGVEDCDNISATAKCEFDSMDVGENKPLTLTSSPAITLIGENKSNYTLVSKDITDGTGTIEPLEITVPAQTFDYVSGTTGPRTFTATVTTTVRRGSETSTKNVDVEYTTSGSDVGVYSYGGSEGNTYTAKVTNSGNFEITDGEPVSIKLKPAVTITASSTKVTYGDKDLTITVESEDILALGPGCEVTIGVNGEYPGIKAELKEGKYVATVPVLSVNGFAAPTGTTSTSTSSNTITAAVNGAECTSASKVTVTVSKKTISATIASYTKPYDGTTDIKNSEGENQKLALELVGLEDCDKNSVTIDPQTCKFTSADAGENVPITLSTTTGNNLNPNGKEAGFYTLPRANVTGTGTISKAEKTVTLPDTDITVYFNGTTTFTKNVTVDLDGEQVSIPVTYTTAAADAGDYLPGEYTVSTNYSTVITGSGKLIVQALKFTTSTANSSSVKVTTKEVASEHIYDGTDQHDNVKVTVEITLNGETVTLMQGTDYDVVCNTSNSTTGDNTTTKGKIINVSSSSYYAHINGKGNYTGTVNATFKVKARDIANATAVLSEDTFTATGEDLRSEISGKITVTDDTLPGGSKVLVLGTDYTVSFATRDGEIVTEVTEIGEYTVTITGKSNYNGEIKVTETVKVAAPESQEITEDMVKLNQGPFTYTGESIDLEITVMDKSIALDLGTDYTVSYTRDGVSVNEIIDAGEYTVTITGTGSRYKGSISKTITVNRKSITEGMVTLDQETFTYTGSDITPVVTVTDEISGGPTALKPDMDYKVTYTRDNQEVTAVKDAGTYKVTVNGTGNYDGTVTLEITVGKVTLVPSVVEGSVHSREYDGTPDTTGTITLAGAVSGEQPTASGTFKFTDKNAEENKTVNVTGITLGSGWETNYELSTDKLEGVSTSAKITRLAAELSWDYTGPFNYQAGQTYTVTATLTNMVEDDAVELIYGGTTSNDSVGTYEAKVTSFGGADGGNYTLEGAKNATLEWSIGAKSIANAEVKVTSSHTYDGTDQAGRITFTVTLEGDELNAAADYTVASYSKGSQSVDKVIDAGTYTVTITGQGNYGGTATFDVTVNRKSITEGMVTLDQETFTYTGSAITPVITVTDEISGEPATLKSGEDYTVTYTRGGVSANEIIGAGTYTVTIEGTGNYSGTVAKTVTVNPKSITGDMVTLDQGPFTYNGGSFDLGITVMDGTTALGLNTDYTVSYTRDGGTTVTEIREIGEYTVTITGKGNYTGAVTRTVTVNPPEPTEITRDMVTMMPPPFIYTGESIDLGITVLDENTKLRPGEDYTVTYTRDGNPAAEVRDAGTYTVAVTGTGNYKGTVTISVTVQPKEITGDMVTVPQSPLTYNGSARNPVVTVMDGTTLLSADTHYEVSYSNNINAGTANVTIKGIGNYTGIVAGTFTIDKAKLTPEGVVTVADKVYDGNTDTTGTITLTGKNGEQPTASGTFNFTDKKVGENKVVDVTEITLDSGWEKNYELTTTELSGVTTSAKITPRVVVLMWPEETSISYDGQSHTIEAVLENKVPDDDIVLIYEDSVEKTEPGSYLAKVTGLGGADRDNYTLVGVENTTMEWSIGAKPLEGAKVTVTGTYTYNGSAQTPADGAVIVTLNGDTLDPATDYTVDYADNTNAGAATVTVTGKGSYAGTATGTFTIDKAKLTPKGVGTVADKVYDGNTDTTGTITLDGAVNGEQPTASGTFRFKDKNVGEDKHVDVTGITLDSGWEQNYELTTDKLEGVSTSAKITQLVAELSWNYTGPFNYQAGRTYTVTATLTNMVDGDKVELIYGGDTSGSNVGTYETTVTDFSGDDSGNYTLDGVESAKLRCRWEITGGEALTNAIVTVAAGTYTYSGIAQTPAVTVKLNNATLDPGTDYTVAYANNINAGAATVTVTGKGNYTGTATGSFTINQATLTPSVGMVVSKTYDGTADAFGTIVLAGAKGSDRPTATATFAFADKNAGENKIVNVTGIALGSQWKTNYALSVSSLSAAASITARKAAFVWDYAGPFEFTGSIYTVTATLTNMVGGDDVTLICEGNEQSKKGEHTARVTGLKGTDSINYTLEGATGTELTWKISLMAALQPQNPTVEEGMTVEVPTTLNTKGIHYTVSRETAVTVTGTGSLYLTTGTIESQNGAGIAVQPGGFLCVDQAGMTVIGTTYGLDISSGAAARLSGGTFTGTEGAIRADDYRALLASGYAFFDEDGTPVPLSEIEGKTTVRVDLCEAHSYHRYTPDSGVPVHDVTCEYCGTTASTERCTFSFDENGQAECERCGHRISAAIDVSDDGNTSVTVVLDGTALTQNIDYWVNTSAGIGAVTVTVTGMTYIGTCEKTFITGTEQPAAPSVGINYADEKLVGTDATMQYHTGDNNWKTASPDMSLASIGWIGEAMTVCFRYPAGNGNAESETQTLYIPARPGAPSVALTLTKTSASITVTGVDAAPGMMRSARAISRSNMGYEFSLGNAFGSGNGAGGKFTELDAGKTYTILVRTPADGNTFASFEEEWPVTTVDGNGSTWLKPGETATSEDGTIVITNNGVSVAVKDGNENTAATVTPRDPDSDGVEVNLSGSVTVPKGGTVQMGGSSLEMILPEGGTVDKTGVTADQVVIGDTTVIPPDDNHTFTPNEDGSVNVPSGSTVTDANGSTTASSQGGTISSGGSYKDNSADDPNTGGGSTGDNTGDGGNTENPEQPGCDCTQCGCAEGTCGCEPCACDQCPGIGDTGGGENTGDGDNTGSDTGNGSNTGSETPGSGENTGGETPGSGSTGGNSSTGGGGNTGGNSSIGGSSTGGNSSAGGGYSGGGSSGGSSSAGGSSSGGGSYFSGSVVAGDPGTGSGAITTNVSNAKKGDTVTVSAKADNGYISGAPTVTDKNGDPVAVTKNADGTYSFTMPEGGVTVTGSFLTPGQMFSDLNDDAWYRDSIAYVVENGLMIGEGGPSFNPGGTTTRGMIMTILARQFGVDTTPADGESWYQKGMDWAMQAGISDGTNPEGSISREQLATMLWRFADEPEVTGELSAYSDAGDIHADWAGSAMIWSVQAGIIQGYDGKLNPRGNAIRTEAAAMLARFCQFIEK